MYGISHMFSILFYTTSGILNSTICAALFSNSLNSVFNKGNKETFLCLSSITCKKRKAERIPKKFSFNNKRSLYLSLILALHFCEEQTCQAGT